MINRSVFGFFYAWFFSIHLYRVLFFLKILLIYSKTQREGQRHRQGEAGSMQGARCGTRSRVSRIRPWVEGGAKPLSHWAVYPIFVREFKA